jgi:trimeric autotransporter adhesin
VVRPIVFWSATLFAVAMLGCGGSTQEIVAPPTGTRCQMSLDGSPSFPAAGARVMVRLAAARDCTWTAQPSDTWLQVEPTSGQGDGTLTLTATENPLGRLRTATLNINSQPFTVTQEATPCRFQAAPSTVTAGHQGGRASIQLSTLEGCSWTTQSSQPWLRVVSGSGGEASATIEVAIDSNTGPERSGLLTVATLLVVVNQNPAPDDRTRCQFSLDPGARLIPAAGGSGSFRLSTLPGCAWSAASNQPWITIVSSPNMNGAGDVQYRVDANITTTMRSGAITAGTRRHVVQQEAAARQ